MTQTNSPAPTEDATRNFLGTTHEGQQIAVHLFGLSQLIYGIQTIGHSDSLEVRHGKFTLDNRLEINFTAIQLDQEYAAAVVHYLQTCAVRLQALAHSLTRRTDLRIDSFVRAYNDNGWTIGSILATGNLQLVSTYGYIPRDIHIEQLEAENPLSKERL